MKVSSDKKKRGVVGRVVLCVLLFLMLLLTFSYHWVTQEFGSISFAEIIFALYPWKTLEGHRKRPR